MASYPAVLMSCFVNACLLFFNYDPSTSHGPLAPESAVMGFAVRVRSAGQKYGPTCHQRDRADVTEFVTLVRLSSLGQHVGVLALSGYKRRKSAPTADPIAGCKCGADVMQHFCYSHMLKISRPHLSKNTQCFACQTESGESLSDGKQSRVCLCQMTANRKEKKEKKASSRRKPLTTSQKRNLNQRKSSGPLIQQLIQ